MALLPDELREAAADNPGKSHWLTATAINDIRNLVKMAAERHMESLNLYRPTSFQRQFHSCAAKEALLSKGNQTGGSLAGFAEIARAVTAQDPHGKYREKDGIAATVAYGSGHIGRVAYRYLRKWGAFEIIRDKDSGLWRTYRPWPGSKSIEGEFGDLERADEARPAPPLIPERFLDSLSWVKKSENIFSLMTFKTGWELYAFNSAGDYEHAQGFQCDLFHIDEDTATGGWVAESFGRLSKRQGLFRWTAMPHAKTEDIPLLLQRAEDEEARVEKEGGDPQTVVIYAGIDENPYLPEETKEQNKRIWRNMGDEEYARRVEGRLKAGSLNMYPSFNLRVHEAIVQLDQYDLAAEHAGKEMRHKVQKILTESNGVPPADWTRYVSIDPGHTITACMFAASPPLALGEFIVLYDELYIPQCTATIFVDAFRQKMKSQQFREFILDFHGAKIASLVDGRRTIDEYEKLFKKYDLECEVRGARFMPACDVLKLREHDLREALAIRHEGAGRGYPKLLVVSKRCPNFVKEIGRFRKKVTKINGQEVVLDEANRNGMCHAVECVEALASHGCEYVRPRMGVKDIKAKMMDPKRKVLKQYVPSVNMSSGNQYFMGPRGIN